MDQVLFVSKPVAPPWNDSSKNLVRDIAGHLQRRSPILMGRKGQENPIGMGRIAEVYGPPSDGGFSPALSDNLSVLRHLLLGRSANIWHFFFAPNPKSSAAGRFAKTLRRVPTVHTVCSVPSESVNMKRVLFADVTVVLSRFSHDRFVQAGVPESALRVIPPSVPAMTEPSAHDRSTLRQAHSLPNGVPVWIYPGDLEFGGGAEIALEAFAASGNRDAILLMACRRKTSKADDALSALKEQAHKWGIDQRIRWVGETPKIHELLALSDFVVMVNRSPYAKMDYPLVVLESMLLGRAVVVGEGTPSEELTASGGALAVATDGQAVADVIDQLGDDAARRSDVEKGARELVESKLSPREVAAQYEHLYDELHA